MDAPITSNVHRPAAKGGLSRRDFVEGIQRMSFLVAAMAASTLQANERPWQLEVGVGAWQYLDKSKDGEERPELLLCANGEYRTRKLGTFRLEVGSLAWYPTLSWDVLEGAHWGLGTLLGYREGAEEGEVLGRRGPSHAESTADTGVQGYLRHKNLTLFAEWRHALRKEQGTLAILGSTYAWEPSRRFEVSFTARATWADAEGLESAAEALRFMADGANPTEYGARRGWQEATMELEGSWQFSRSWSLAAGLACQRPLGSETRYSREDGSLNFSGMASLSFRF